MCVAAGGAARAGTCLCANKSCREGLKGHVVKKAKATTRNPYVRPPRRRGAPRDIIIIIPMMIT